MDSIVQPMVELLKGIVVEVLWCQPAFLIFSSDVKAVSYTHLQLIAEAYWVMKNLLGLDNGQMAEIFADWNLSLIHI